MAHSHITCLVLLWSPLLLTAISLVIALPTNEKNEDRCIDFELSRVNAITNLANGSLFMVSGAQYWILAPNEVPSLKTARQVSRLFFTSSEENSSDSVKPPVPTIEAAVNLRIKAHEGACVPADQTILYSWNSILYTTSNISHVGVFGAANSVNWTRKIDGVTFWQNMTIIFQGNSFISLKCSNGEWREVVHKEIANVFPGVAHRALDSVLIRNIDAEQMADLATVYMFFGHEYYECSVTGNDPCEGPYSLMSEFFNVDHYCLDSTIGRAESQRRFLITGLIFASIILFALIVVLAVLYFTLKPEHFTYFVNRKMNRNNRDNLSYEALKLQSDGNTAGQVETKSVTNGKS